MVEKCKLYSYRAVLSMTLFFSIFICAGTIANVHDKVFSDILSSTSRFIMPLMLAGLLYLFICLMYHWFDRISDRAVIISTAVLFGIMAVIFSIILLNFCSVPSTDALNLQDTAMYLTESKKRPIPLDAPHIKYFGRVSNNYFLTILFMYFFKILAKIGISDIYIPLQLLAVMGVMTAALFMYLIGVKLGGRRMGVKVLAICVMNPVYYVLVLWVYTNVLSLPFTIAVIYFGLCIYKSETEKKGAIACVLEIVTVVLGYYIRATVIIPLIALIVCAFIWMLRNRQRMLMVLKYMAICALVGILLIKSVSVLNETYFSSVSESTLPVTHWFMMGSHGTGEHNSEDFEYTEKYETKKEKTKATIKKIIENYKQYSLPEFFAFQHEKLIVSWCFGDGGDILTKAAQDRRQTRLYSWVLGDRADLFRLYCYAFRIANMFLIILALCRFLRSKELDIGMFLFTLTFLGGILFHCIWEAKASYAAPFIYVMLFIGMKGGCILESEIFSNDRIERMKQKVLIEITGVIIMLCVCLVSYYNMTHIEVTLRDWSVRCFEGNSIENIISDEPETVIFQEFYAKRPVNRIALMGWADKEAKENNLSYQMRIFATDKCELYSGIITANDIQKSGDILIKIDEIVPKGRECFRLQLIREKGSKGKMYIKQRNSGYVDTYDGTLSVDGKARINDLYLQAYREYRSAWCSKAVGMFVNGAIFGFAIFIWFGIWISERKDIHFTIRRK